SSATSPASDQERLGNMIRCPPWRVIGMGDTQIPSFYLFDQLFSRFRVNPFFPCYETSWRLRSNGKSRSHGQIHQIPGQILADSRGCSDPVDFFGCDSLSRSSAIGKP